jgi:hypothetical protein
MHRKQYQCYAYTDTDPVLYVPGRSSLGRTRARLPTRNHKPVVHGDRTSSHPPRSATSSILILARCRAGTIAARGDHGARRSCKEMDRSCPRPAHGPSIHRRGGRIGTVLAPPGPRPRPAASSAQRRLAVRIDHTRWGRRAHWLLRASPNGVS